MFLLTIALLIGQYITHLSWIQNSMTSSYWLQILGLSTYQNQQIMVCTRLNMVLMSLALTFSVCFWKAEEVEKMIDETTKVYEVKGLTFYFTLCWIAVFI